MDEHGVRRGGAECGGRERAKVKRNRVRGKERTKRGGRERERERATVKRDRVSGKERTKRGERKRERERERTECREDEAEQRKWGESGEGTE